MTDGIGDLLNQTLLGAHEGFERYATCFPGCEGHSDSSTAHEHSTPWEYFGEFGVTVTQTDGEAPQISLVDMPHPVASYSPAHARVLAYQILLAADMAERLAQPSPTEHVARLLAEALRAISN